MGRFSKVLFGNLRIFPGNRGKVGLNGYVRPLDDGIDERSEEWFGGVDDKAFFTRCVRAVRPVLFGEKRKRGDKRRIRATDDENVAS